MSFKDKITNVCALITITSGAFVTIVALPLELPVWAIAIASFIGTVATGYSQWLIGKDANGKKKMTTEEGEL